jgi:cytochrome c553
MKTRTWIATGIAALLTASIAFQVASPTSSHNAHADSPQAKTAVTPVEPSMHEFMEYVFEEPYKRLKTAMATEPADRSAWKVIKSDALILAEAGNLLLMRLPEENAATWREHSAAVRDGGGEFYQAARKRDYAAAKASYTALLQKCNACHNDFADGEHQLTP